ncbi:hypothetical protein SAMN05892877_1277 [Rhizobium subbaraonis]|uniref:Uncharacterized protein n=1 Tax=Rhizobium subbaraonis TaxID=908946 RepID=A0A285V272_9HYPH|nr:hypothetical protein [Rhizobium subbaraonis]SOC47096.1 hypothetical protein SAMN05892877_1277 [Rhizobium subbaraonis]
MSEAVANPLRGEADVTLGAIDFRIAVTWSGLVKLSRAMKADGMNEVYTRLLAFEPFAVTCAVRALIVADDEDKASGLSAKILSDSNISLADAESWQAAIEVAFTAHTKAGAIKRDERTAHQIAEDFVLGKPIGPS